MFRIRTLTVTQGLQWLSCGLRFWSKRPLEGTVPIAVFMLVAGLLRLIPVIGDVLLLLILPTVAASYLIHVHILSAASGARRGTPGDVRAKLERHIKGIRAALFGAWSKPENIFPLALIGFALVFLGVITYALYTLVGGQGVVSPLEFYELSATQMLRVILAHTLASLIWLIVTALLFWTLPLFTIRDVPLFSALRLNLRALLRNVRPLAVYLLILASGFLPAAILSIESRLAGYLLLWLSGTAIVCLFGFSAYCSFRLVFAEQASSPRTSGVSAAEARRAKV